MMNKRDFLKSMIFTAGMPLAGKASEWIAPQIDFTSSDADDFWKQIQADYQSSKDFINLENGYYSIMSNTVMEKYIREIAYTNCEGSHYMRTVQFENKWKTRDRLANLLGCSKDELIITRNTTESLDTIISGISWKQGDEVVLAYQDYGSMIDMFHQQAKRFGIKLKMVSVPNHPQSDELIISTYENAITTKTKLLMVCHMINITGQILPIKKIVDMAHQKGVEVMVDGAHAVAHIDFKLSELNCDYYGSSLHKWLGAPLGAGILFVRKDKIKNIWPLFGERAYAEDDIRKLNHTGTNPVAVDIAIGHAIDYHLQIGIKRKEERLRFLQQYWTKQLTNHDRIRLNTPLDNNRSCAIANVTIEGYKPADLAKILMDKHKIWTVAIDNAYAGVQGIRVTPHLYTQTAELDQFVEALQQLSK